MSKIMINNIVRDMTEEEQSSFDTERNLELSKIPEYKLEKVRVIRNEKLFQTDWLVTSEKIIDAEKTWRQSLRDIPADHTDENAYDLLLARDPSTKELTHAIWRKP